MCFDGSIFKEGSRACLWIITSNGGSQVYSFKLDFECFKNISEYEALVIGLSILEEKRAKKIHIFGDSKLIINQVKGIYQTKNPRMRAYKNEFWDLFHNFTFEPKISAVSRQENCIADSLASTSMFKIPIYQNKKY